MRTNTLPTRLVALLTLVLASAALAQMDDPAEPTLVSATDLPGLKALVDKPVILDGTVESAQWSSSGKVMTIRFKGAGKTVQAAAFERQKKKLDESFMGDAAKTLTGAHVRLSGTLKKYGGSVEAQEDAMEVILSSPSQITIIKSDEPATTMPGE